MIKDSIHFKQLFEEFKKRYSDRHYFIPKLREAYNDAFRDGHIKAEIVSSKLKSIGNIDFSKTAYVSIGGADGSEIINFMKNNNVSRGILLE